jgi:hypothetical protein
MNDAQDPGWWPALKRLPRLMIPFRGRPGTGRRPEADGLTGLRLIFIGIVGSLWMSLGVLLSIVDPKDWFAPGHVGWFPALVVAAGVASVLRLRSLGSRPLDPSSLTSLAASYRDRMFIGIAVSEAPALIAFVGTFLMGVLWVYLVGLGFSTINLILVGPTRRNLEQLQEAIRSRGSPLSVVEALVRPAIPTA